MAVRDEFEDAKSTADLRERKQSSFPQGEILPLSRLALWNHCSIKELAADLAGW